MASGPLSSSKSINNNGRTKTKVAATRIQVRHSQCLYAIIALLIVYLLGIQRGLQAAANREMDHQERFFVDLWASFVELPSSMLQDLVVDPNANLDLTKPRFTAPDQLLLPKPIINVGFPKAGTSTIFNFFHCNGLRSQHWFCCEDQDTPGGTPVNQLMSRCILNNLVAAHKKHNVTGNATTNPPLVDIFEGCGDFDVYTEINGPRAFKEFNFRILQDDGRLDGKWSASRGRMILPQHHYLEHIHYAYPNATFILNQRPVDDWIRSVLQWPTQLKQELPRDFFWQEEAHPSKFSLTWPEKNYTGIALPNARLLQRLPEILTYIYEFHNDFVRDFVKKHPSHALIEVDITHNESGQILADAFGLQESCWGHANQNKRSNNNFWKGKNATAYTSRRAVFSRAGGGHNMTRVMELVQQRKNGFAMSKLTAIRSKQQQGRPNNNNNNNNNNPWLFPGGKMDATPGMALLKEARQKRGLGNFANPKQQQQQQEDIESTTADLMLLAEQEEEEGNKFSAMIQQKTNLMQQQIKARMDHQKNLRKNHKKIANDVLPMNHRGGGGGVDMQ